MTSASLRNPGTGAGGLGGLCGSNGADHFRLPLSYGRHCQGIGIGRLSELPHVEWDEGDRTSARCYELNENSFGAYHLDDRPEESLLQSLRAIDRENYWLELGKRHGSVHPGYAVTNRGKTSPKRTIQILLNSPDRPFGPANVPRIE